MHSQNTPRHSRPQKQWLFCPTRYQDLFFKFSGHQKGQGHGKQRLSNPQCLLPDMGRTLSSCHMQLGFLCLSSEALDCHHGILGRDEAGGIEWLSLD